MNGINPILKNIILPLNDYLENFSIGNEYTHNFRDGAGYVTTVGESFINPYTRYQSLLGISLYYNVFDFGVRKNKMDFAKGDESIEK